jgi:hypothetical protein
VCEEKCQCGQPAIILIPVVEIIYGQRPDPDEFVPLCHPCAILAGWPWSYGDEARQ